MIDRMVKRLDNRSSSDELTFLCIVVSRIHRIPRIFWVIIGGIVMIVAQIVLLTTFSLNSIYIGSVIVGIAYGGIFFSLLVLISDDFVREKKFLLLFNWFCRRNFRDYPMPCSWNIWSSFLWNELRVPEFSTRNWNCCVWCSDGSSLWFWGLLGKINDEERFSYISFLYSFLLCCLLEPKTLFLLALLFRFQWKRKFCFYLSPLPFSVSYRLCQERSTATVHDVFNWFLLY